MSHSLKIAKGSLPDDNWPKVNASNDSWPKVNLSHSLKMTQKSIFQLTIGQMTMHLMANGQKSQQTLQVQRCV